MPPLTLHMAVARDANAALRSSARLTQLGAYYLGATTPDIRVLTGWERERTHFYDIHSFEPQSSVDRLFQEFPELAKPERLDPATVAFIAGYISHLCMDQAYIEMVYRLHFAEDASDRDRLAMNLMDRILQYELDRRRREDPDAMSHIREELRNAPLDIKVAFVEPQVLARWRDLAAEVSCNPPDWVWFRRIAARLLQEAGIDSEEQLEAFVADVPRLLDETIEHVQQQRIDEFMERSFDETVRTLARYLDCA